MTIDPFSYATLLQAYALTGLYGVAPSLLATPSAAQIGATSIDQTLSADQVEISSLAQLSSTVLGFQGTMQSLETPDQVAPAQINSSDGSTASASALATAPTGTYKVTVANLAQAQTLESGAVTDPNSTVIGTGTLTIQLGNYDAGSNSFTPGANAPTSVDITGGSLADIAAAINGADAGVAASVVQDQSGYHLVLSSASTGAANGFSLTVQDSDGSNTDTSGLSQLAYDPTAAAGAGKNLTETQAGQDAALSVNGVNLTSASNSGVGIATGVTLDLLQPGSTTVTVSQNDAAMVTAAQSFVDAYNALQSTLAGITAVGAPLAGDSAAGQLQQELAATYLQSYAGGGSFDSLAQIGITAQSDGALSLDPTALQSSLNSDPTGTVSLFNQAAQAFDSLSNDYAGPGGTIPLESSAVQQSALDLSTIAGGFDTAASVSQSTALQQYQAALKQSYQAELDAREVTMLLTLLQAQELGGASAKLLSGNLLA